MRRRIFIWGLSLSAFLIVYTSISVVFVRWATTKRAACLMPCQDLGLEVAIPPKKRESLAVYKPRCVPLKLELELHRPLARRNTRYALWHRVTLTNDSCYRLLNISRHEFVVSLETENLSATFARNGALQIRVWDSDGRELVPGNFKVESPRTYLYFWDSAAFRKLDQRSENLEPGESIVSIPSVLMPTVDYEGVNMQTGDHERLFMPRPVPIDAETPPAGFKILDLFVFERPGTYTIQAVFESKVDAEPILPYEKRIPFLLHLPVYLLEKCGLDFYPDSRPLLSNDYLVHVESERIPFTVAP